MMCPFVAKHYIVMTRGDMLSLEFSASHYHRQHCHAYYMEMVGFVAHQMKGTGYIFRPKNVLYHFTFHIILFNNYL